MSLLDFYRGWRALFFFLLGAWLVERWWVRQLRQGLRLHREMRFSWAQVGDRLEERFTLENRALAPALWVTIADHSTFLHAPARRATGVQGRGHTRWTVHHTCTRRGLFTLGPTVIHTSGPFGLLPLTLNFPESRTLLVTPPVLPLPPIEIAAGGRAGEGRPRQASLEPTVSAAGVRPYQPGESMRHIHWPTSARRGTLYSRRFENTPASDWWLLLDLCADAHTGQGDDSTLEDAITLTASLAARALSGRRAVGLGMYGQRLTWLPLAAGDTQRQRIMQHLALAEAGDQPLGTLLTRLENRLRPELSLVLITADTRPAWLEALLPLMRRGVLPTVLLLDPRPYGGDSPQALLETLHARGIHAHLLPPALFTRPEAAPGRRGRWEWKVTPLGRAIPAMPEDLRWVSE
ncbi:MAG: DUF58 domain-containing protein [Deltaproteobacteria bacterium]|nr:MAG: DUF58 domain-containing protein [Deltaproteobacteria bacterium]